MAAGSIDLNGMTPTQRRSLSKAVARTMEISPNMHGLLDKIVYLKGMSVAGDSFNVFPGFVGMDMPENLPNGQEIKIGGAETFHKEIKLKYVNLSHGMSRAQANQISVFSDPTEYITRVALTAMQHGIWCALIEYMTANAGHFKIFPEDYDTNTWQDEAFFLDTHFGSRLDNIVLSSGVDAVEKINKDYFQLLKQLKNGRLPGSRMRYWEGVSSETLEPVIVAPVELEEVMMKAFSADVWPAMMADTTYNAEGTNMLTRMKPKMVFSSYLSEISTTAWYVIMSSKTASPSEQAFMVLFNNKSELQEHSSESDKQGVEIPWKDQGKFLTVEQLGPGTDEYVKKRRWVHSVTSQYGIFGTNPYRAGVIQ